MKEIKSKTDFTCIKGKRDELEAEFVRSIFTNDTDTYNNLSQKLKKKARLSLVSQALKDQDGTEFPRQ